MALGMTPLKRRMSAIPLDTPDAITRARPSLHTLN